MSVYIPNIQLYNLLFDYKVYEDLVHSVSLHVSSICTWLNVLVLNEPTQRLAEVALQVLDEIFHLGSLYLELPKALRPRKIDAVRPKAGGKPVNTGRRRRKTLENPRGIVVHPPLAI